MKKIAIILLALLIAGGTVMAQEDGMGLYVGGELVIADFNDAGDTMATRAYVGYETSFGAIDVYAEAGTGIPLYDYADIGLDMNAGVDYNLSISDSSKLKFGAGLWLFFPFGDKYGMWTNVTPYGTYFAAVGGTDLNLHMNFGVTFTQTMGFGDLYFGFDVPFLLVADNADPFDIAEFNFTVGLDMEMGVGFGFTLYDWIGAGNLDFIQNLEIFGTYTSGPLFVGLTIGVPLFDKGIDALGIYIIPEFSYTLDFGLEIYAELPISNIANDVNNDIGIGLTVGVKFSF